ncbi:hypothetical protein [Streptomyces sp. Amel2xC10]|uniref:hypothetical protein n=1 Tax=Streptomyces sp. Amel2xC10 TaxID=1305826 RepID=UPI000A087523|nr:hypothetical protein [Streptomyces sp. Amel2xC10]SMF86130.1 hypothetical protein SAMN02745830_07132 [Streptomyces sp. Amel2xC10]
MRTGDDLRRIARELNRMDNQELKKRFRKELRAVAQPYVPLVRNSIRNIPSKRPYTAEGLRGRMVKATRIEVRTVGRDAGVAIRVDGRKMPPSMKALPKGMEGTKRWRHPVFGNRENWVTQKPSPYFFKVVRLAGVAGRRAASQVVDSITRDIR